MKMRPRADVDPSEWDAFVERHPNGWWWHTSEWLDYQMRYRPHAVDLSVAFISSLDRVVAVVPVIAEAGVASFDGDPEPLHAKSEADMMAVTMLEWLRDAGVRRWVTSARPAPEPCPTATRVTRVIRLDRPRAELWRELRKSYHSLIHRAEERYVVNVSEDIWVCRTLHVLEAGRETRSKETWSQMGQWVREGNGVIILARRPNGETAGFVYAIVMKGWAYYASSAVRAADGLGHLLQWSMIEALKALGVTRYEMGYLPDDPSAKDLGIQHFKRGFGGEDWPVRRSDVIIQDISAFSGTV